MWDRGSFAGVCAAGLVVLLSATGCDRGPGAASRDPFTIPLVDRFSDENLHERREVETIAPTTWSFGEPSPGLTWEGGPGVADLAVSGEMLSGRAASERPVLALSAENPLGEEDTLHSIEVRMRASAGSEMALTVLGEEGPPNPAFAEEEPALALTTPLLPGEEMKTYTFTRGQIFPRGPIAWSGIQRVVLRPTNAADATFAIESVRLVFRKEYLAGVASGVGWHGLGEVYRESLVSRPGESVRIPVKLPDRPWLDLAVGSIGPSPVRFRAAVVPAGAEEEATVLRRTVTSPDRWEPDPVDLAEWAGREVELVLRVESDDPHALGFWGSPAIRSRESGPAAPDADRPQGVILVIADTLRRDHLESWGYERPTAPHVASLAQRGTRFADAVSQGVWTKVSVPSLMSSLYPSSHGITDFTHRLPAAATTIAEAFRGAGYATFATSSIPFTGQLSNLHQGFEELHEAGSLSTEDDRLAMKTAREYVERTLGFVESHRDVPFFATLHVADPHGPYRPLDPWDAHWADLSEAPWFGEAEEALREEIPPGARRFFVAPTRTEMERAGVEEERFVRLEKDWYDGSIRGMDAEIGRLIDRLAHLGLDDRVVVAFVSDHGEEFLEHGSHFHGRNVYGENTNVPMVFWGPRFVPEGVTVETTVQLLDVMPTLLDLAGIPVPEGVQGKSLMPLARAADGEIPADWRDRPAFSERLDPPSMPADIGGDETTVEGFAIVKGRWKLVENVDSETKPRFELYDHREDPLNQTDVAADHPEVVTALAADLERWRAWTAERRMEEEDLGSMDAAELERLRSLGYVN